MSEQHTTAPHRLRFGTTDWRRPDWVGGYYPEDLPEDWQLGYYANESAAVLLLPEAWRDAGAAVLSGWADEAHEDFRFYLLADAAADPAAQQALAAALGDRLGGLLWPTAPAPSGLAAPLPDQPARVQAWGDAAGLRLVLLDVAGLDLRGRRAMLDMLAPALTAAQDAALILAGAGVTPADARELQTVAELMGLA